MESLVVEQVVGMENLLVPWAVLVILRSSSCQVAILPLACEGEVRQLLAGVGEVTQRLAVVGVARPAEGGGWGEDGGA